MSNLPGLGQQCFGFFIAAAMAIMMNYTYFESDL